MSDLAAKADGLFLAIRFVHGIVERIHFALAMLSPVAGLSVAQRSEYQETVLEGARLLPQTLAGAIERCQNLAGGEDGAMFAPVLSALEGLNSPLKSLLATLGANAHGAQGDEPIDLALSFQRANEELERRRDALATEPALREAMEEHGRQVAERRTNDCSSSTEADAVSAENGAQVVKQPTTPEPANAESEVAAPKSKQKRSTVRGEAEAKIIAALTQHHQYADGSCLNLEPIGNNELARLVKVSPSTVSEFFKKQFGGRQQYQAACCDKSSLIAALKLLNKEFSPHQLFGNAPPGERDRNTDIE